MILNAAREPAPGPSESRPPGTFETVIDVVSPRVKDLNIVELGIAGIVLLVGCLFAWALIRSFVQELGKFLAGWAVRVFGPRAENEERRLAKQGAHPLAIVAGLSEKRTWQLLEPLISPTPSVARGMGHVHSATESGRQVAVLGLGEGATKEVQLLLESVGAAIIPRARVVEVERVGLAASDARMTVGHGSLELQVADACAWLQTLDDSTELLLLLRPPFTASWHESAETFATILDAILASGPPICRILLMVPSFPAVWPSRLVLELPRNKRELRRDPVVRRYARQRRRCLFVDSKRCVLSGRTAALLLNRWVDAAFSDAWPARDRPPPTRLPPNYGALLLLALTRSAGNQGVSMARSEVEAQLLATLLASGGVTVLSGSGLRSPFTVSRFALPQFITGERSAVPVSSSSGGSSMSLLAIARAEESIDRGDQAASATVISEYGRAWLEEVELTAGLRVLERAAARFDSNSSAGVWARLFLALDGALRLEQPDKALLGLPQTVASGVGVESLQALIEMERIEFRRLKGGLAEAVPAASAMRSRLEGLASQRTEDRYAKGTALFVLANTLRAGGRYDLARNYIERAAEILDRRIPSHRVELLHCQYALSVCSSMYGSPSVSAAGLTHEAQGAAFARALLTLANSHAAWFVGDFERAIAFATDAAEQFARIGYGRYRRRSLELYHLLRDWQTLEIARGRGQVASQVSLNSALVGELLSLRPGAETDVLGSLRPSRALSLLQFCVRFGEDPSGSRPITLPDVIAVGQDAAWHLAPTVAAISFAQAEARLRSAMALPQEVKVPLAAD